MPCAMPTSERFMRCSRRLARSSIPIDRLRKMGETYITFALRYPGHYRFMFMTPRVHHREDVDREIEQGNPDQDSYAFVRATVVEALAAGVFRESTKTPICFRRWCWSAVHGVASLHLIMGKGEWIQWRPAEEVARTAVDVMIRGLVRSGGGKKG